jgi:2Fe-2S ferredoxin
MASITFITPDGARMEVRIKPGATVMEAAVARETPGIEAQCYGAGVCGTCHVYACGPLAAHLAPKSQWELEMLGNLPLARPESRLACQIRFEERFDGAEFRIPERQDAMG